MRPVLFLLVCLQLAFGEEVYDRERRQTETCEECKINFNTERSAALTPQARCRALKNYITCRSNTSTSWPGCDVTYDDGNALSSYYYAIEKNCELSDACQCQVNKWFNTGSYNKASYYVTYMTCLYESVMPGCDDVTTPQQLIKTAQLFQNDGFRSKDTCRQSYDYSMNYANNDNQICSNVEDYLSCLGEVAVGGQDVALNYTEREQLQATLDSADYCEISMTDTCHCQKAFLVKSHADQCTAASEFVTCMENSYMQGCNSNDYVYRVRSLAKLAKAQQCPNDPEYKCDGAENCYIDMNTLSKDNTAIQTQSCSSLKDYTSCLRNSIPSTCGALNTTVEYLDQKRDNKLWCYNVDNGQGYSTYYPGYSTYYPGYSTYYPGYSTYYPGYSTYYPGYSTDYPGYSTSYPGYYTTYPGYYTPYPVYTTYPYPYSTQPGVSEEEKWLLMSAIQAAQLEAEETLHAAEEAVQAIDNADEIVKII